MSKIKSAFLIDNDSRKMSKEELERRKEMETKLKGKNDKLIPPTYLTEGAKSFFEYIVNELEESGILSNLDLFLVTQTAITLDEFQTYETIKQTTTNLEDKMKIGKYQDMLVRQNKQNFADLCLSPTSRARLSNMQLEKREEEEDPLLKALRELNNK